MASVFWRARWRRVFHRSWVVALVTAALAATLLLGSRALADGGGLAAALWLVPWVALGIAGPVALVAGGLQGLALGFVLVFARRRRCGAAARVLTNRHRARREAVVGAHVAASRLALALFTLAALTFAMGWLLERIQDSTLRNLALATLAAGLGLVALGVSIATRAALARFWAFVDAHRRLPLLGPSLALAGFAAAPLALSVGLLARYGDVLGVALWPVLALGFVSAEAMVWAVLRKLSLGRRTQKIALSLSLLSALSTPLLLDAEEQLGELCSQQPVVGGALDWLRRPFDFDGDGASATYGGGDCAPLDGTIAPSRADFPGNGIDENCDGRDAEPLARRDALRYADALQLEQTREYDVLWIIVDAMRAERTSLHGARRDTTPYLRTLADSFVVFDRAYVSATTTHLSIPSMLVGKEALAIDWEYRGDPRRVELADDEETLAELLASAGYATAAVVSNHIRRLGAITRGFEVVRESPSKSGASRTNLVARRLQEKLRRDERPYFLLVYYGDPHQPYERHPLGPDFGDAPIDVYDGELAHVDRSLGTWLEELFWDREALRNTIVVVTSDHGEEFREHGKTGHGAHCHEETMRVPLLFRAPSLEPRRIDSIVSTADIVPTILELTGLRELDVSLGQSLLMPALRPERLDAERVVTCVATKQGSSEGRAYYVRAGRTRNLFFQEERVSGAVQLFDTQRDPGERNDVSGQAGFVHERARLQDVLLERELGNLWERRRD